MPIFSFGSKKRVSDNHEICAVCHRKTEISKSLPLEQREYYIEGIGQLCSRCYSDLCDPDTH